MSIADIIVVGTLIATTCINSALLAVLTWKVDKLLQFAYESRGRKLAAVK